MREVEVESRFGRLPATVTGALSRSLGPTERMKTAEFLAVECRLATLDPHMRSNDMLNIACRRSAANGDLVCAYTEYEDVVREGLAVESLLGGARVEGRHPRRGWVGRRPLGNRRPHLGLQGVQGDVRPRRRP